jgi:hypothetical protein
MIEQRSEVKQARRETAFSDSLDNTYLEEVDHFHHFRQAYRHHSTTVCHVIVLDQATVGEMESSDRQLRARIGSLRLAIRSTWDALDSAQQATGSQFTSKVLHCQSVILPSLKREVDNFCSAAPGVKAEIEAGSGMIPHAQTNSQAGIEVQTRHDGPQEWR